jgi:hypothetical protein
MYLSDGLIRDGYVLAEVSKGTYLAAHDFLPVERISEGRGRQRSLGGPKAGIHG